jgi:hypothetical protein
MMAKKIHKIVPAADTIIVLRSRQVCFAVWDRGDTEVVVTGQQASGSGPSLPESTENDAVQEAFIDTEETSVEETAAEETAAEETAAEETAAEETAAEKTATDELISEEEIHYEVCSYQLRQASPKFRSMLSGGNWNESIPNEDDGCYHIHAEDWDEEALLILLNVLHFRNNNVPQSASLDMLAKIVVLAEYYNCLEAVKLLTHLWIKDLKSITSLPSEHCRDLMLWMCIAWVLRLPEEFTHTTAIAIKQSRKEELPTLGLPITGFVGRSVPSSLQEPS